MPALPQPSSADSVKTRINHPAAAPVIAWCCCALTAIAHPVSHTDAWVKVSDVIDVRLNIFLDDVLRHQAELSTNQTTVSRSQSIGAVAQHGRTLLKQLQIFDADGRRLIGRVMSVPEWQPNSEVIDLTTDASLKLSWTLQFVPAESQDGAFRRLSFVHAFSHRDLTQPGELRLHLQHKPANRRIDAILAPEIPHTIILATESSRRETTGSTDINISASRIVVAPNEIIHEFTAPLLLLDVAWPQAIDFRGKLLAGPFNGGHFDPATLQDARQQIATWLQSHCKLRLNDESAPPTDVAVEFFRSPADSFSAMDTLVKADETVPIIGTRVGARVRFPSTQRIESVELMFAESPGHFNQLTVDVVTATERQTQIVDCNRNVENGAAGLRFRWDRNLNITPAASDTALQVSAVAMNSPVRVALRRPGRLGLLSCLVCTAIGFGIWLTGSAKRSHPTVSYGCGAALVLSVVLLFVAPDAVHHVDHKRAGHLVEQLLSNVYRAIAGGDTDALAEGLSTALDEDLAEQIYLSTVQCLHTDQTDGVLINFTKTSVLSIAADEQMSTPRNVYVDCTWLVNGSVYHWGHIHERQMRFSGEIVLSCDNNTWKIASLSPTTFSTIKSEIQSNQKS